MQTSAPSSRPSQIQPAQPAKATQQDRDAALLNQILDREVEYVPFMAKEPIRLTPRMVLRFLCTPTRSGKVCTEEQATKFVMLCKARGLNPWEGDAYLVGYDTQNGPPTFSLITAHQAFLKRAEVHPEYDGMESGVIVRDEAGQVVDRQGDFYLDGDTLLGGWATVYFKNRKHPMQKRVRLATFCKGFGRWKDDPAGMIVKCAEADALRSAFPNTLGGMFLDDEMPGISSIPSPPPVPAALPAGRQSLKRSNGNGHAPVVQVPPPSPEWPEPPPPPECDDQQVQPEPHQADVPPVMEPESPAQPDPEALEKEDFARQVREELAKAQDRKAFEAIGADINENAEWLGKETVEALLAEYRKRYVEVFPQQTRSGKKQQPMLPMT